MYVILIFLFLMGIILAMIGPANISYIINALIVK